MNINTNHVFSGKYLAGSIYPEYLQDKVTVLHLECISNGKLEVVDTKKLGSFTITELQEIRGEINELITFMVSLEPGKEKASDEDKQVMNKAVKEIDKRPICEICKNNVSEGILYCRFNTVPTKTHTCILCGSSRSGTLPFYTFIPYEGIKNE